MPKQLINIRAGVPFLDIASYARRGPGHRDRLSPAEVEQIARTVRRTPEVMVKVLSHGGQDLRTVRRHFDYLRLREDGSLSWRQTMVSGFRGREFPRSCSRIGISTWKSIGVNRILTRGAVVSRS